MGTTVTGLISKFELLKVASRGALGGGLIGAGIGAALVGGNMAGQWMSENMPGTYNFLGNAAKFVFPGLTPVIDWALSRDERDKNWEKESNAWTRENKQFLSDRWKKIQKQLEESGVKGINSESALNKAISAGDIVQVQGQDRRRRSDRPRHSRKPASRMSGTNSRKPRNRSTPPPRGSPR